MPENHAVNLPVSFTSTSQAPQPFVPCPAFADHHFHLLLLSCRTITPSWQVTAAEVHSPASEHRQFVDALHQSMSSFFNVSIACATSCISCSPSLSRSNSASSTYISIFPDPFCKCIPPMKRKIVGTCDTPRRLLNPSLRQGTKALPRDQWYRDRPLPNLRFDGSGRGPLARWSSKLKRFLGIAIQKGERDGMIILIMIKGQFVPEKINITYFLRMTATVARNLTHIQYADYFISHLIWLIHPLIFFSGILSGILSDILQVIFFRDLILQSACWSSPASPREWESEGRSEWNLVRPHLTISRKKWE